MQTTKLISTISFNTPAFLSGVLNRLSRSGVIEYAHWIWHNPESDETKPHAHLVLKPNKRLNTQALRMEFTETVNGEDKPRGVLPFRPSKMGDFILYGSHDVTYLIRKGQRRDYHYKREDWHSTEPDLFSDDWRDCHEGEDNRITLLEEMVKEGLSWPQVVKSGIVPINHLFQYREVYFALQQIGVDRADGESHE